MARTAFASHEARRTDAPDAAANGIQRASHPQGITDEAMAICYTCNSRRG